MFRSKKIKKSVSLKNGVAVQDESNEKIVPTNIKQKNQFGLNAKVWVPSQHDVWRLANVLYADDAKGTITVQLPGGSKSNMVVPLDKICLFDEGQLKDWDDMSKMGDLNEASNLMLLKRRYEQDKIYTLNGDILLSINPYKDIPGIYDSFEGFERPLNKDDQQKPHLYAVADNAYQAMMGTDNILRFKSGKMAQSILINGESGAGKTEASKYVMRYLAYKSHQIREHREQDDVHLSNEIGTAVEQRVIQSNPLLEAFGNAKTIRNDNSSRFGKYIQVHYDDVGCIDGASTQHYLLEKTRIVEHTVNERGYHVFYQMLAGLTDEALRQEFELKSPAEYTYLTPKNGTYVDSNLHDADEFNNTVEAMNTVGISDDEQAEIWKILSALLALGNITFVKAGDSGSEVSPESTSTLELAAKLLGIETSDLETALCFRTVRAGKRVSVSVVKLDPVKANDSRNGLAKAIYSELFNWLVARINESTFLNATNSTTDDQMYIGILDIFGFEVLERNSFEQFCINFANEILQREFDHHVFELEQRLYIEEGIDWSMLTFQDNASLLDLFQKKRTGIFSLLDEQGMLGERANDEGFIRRVYETHATGPETHERFEKPRFDKDSFIIKHFAGAITYHVDGFVNKNNDALHHDLSKLLVQKTEHNGFLHEMCVKAFEHQLAAQHAMTSLFTVSSRLRSQMSKLVETLESTLPHFIRCIKPNQNKSAGEFDPKLVLNQLTYLGVMEAVRIRREGFPVRRSFGELATKYALLLTGTTVRWTPPAKADHVTEEETEHARVACKTILENTLGEASKGHGWQVGKSGKVFLREGILDKLDEAVRELMNRNATALQALMRKRRAQAAMRKKKTAVSTIAARYRQKKAVREYQKDRQQVIKLQTFARSRNEQRKYHKLRELQTSIAAHHRGIQGRKFAKQKRKDYTEACLKIQQCFRMTGPYKEYIFVRNTTSRIQAVWRGTLVRVRWNRVCRLRNPWKKFLKPNEAVAFTSLVIKSTPNKVLKGILSSKKRRQLIITSSKTPRIIYVDLLKMVEKGTIPYVEGVTEAAATSEKDFIIHSEGNEKRPDRTEWNFVDLLDNAESWVEFLRHPITVMDMLQIGSVLGDDNQLRFMRQEVILKQGFLVKLAISSQKNWRKRWFVLYNSRLTWYKGNAAKKAKGSIPISKKTTVIQPKKQDEDEDTSGWREFCLDVSTASLEKPLRIQCVSQNECDQWKRVINEAILASTLEDLKK